MGDDFEKRTSSPDGYWHFQICSFKQKVLPTPTSKLFFWNIYNIILATEVFTKTCFSKYTSLYCNITNHPKQENSMCYLNAPLCFLCGRGRLLLGLYYSNPSLPATMREMRQTCTVITAYPKAPKEGFGRNKSKRPFFQGQHQFEDFVLSYCQAALGMLTENLKTF